MVKSVATVCSEIYDEVRKHGGRGVGAAAAAPREPGGGQALRAPMSDVLEDGSGLPGAEVTIQGDPLLHQEQFDLVPR